MSILTYPKLIKLVEKGYINADFTQVNGASIDITLDNIILMESESVYPRRVVLTDKSQQMQFNNHDLIADGDFIIEPGQFILASSREVFKLPDNIAAEYKLKSTMARNGLNHLNAGWCDPWWDFEKGSKLTLELKNESRNHEIVLTAGMKIGQMIFHQGKPVPKAHGYLAKGQYNGQKTTTAPRGLK